MKPTTSSWRGLEHLLTPKDIKEIESFERHPALKGLSNPDEVLLRVASQRIWDRQSADVFRGLVYGVAASLAIVAAILLLSYVVFWR